MMLETDFETAINKAFDLALDYTWDEKDSLNLANSLSKRLAGSSVVKQDYRWLNIMVGKLVCRVHQLCPFIVFKEEAKLIIDQEYESQFCVGCEVNSTASFRSFDTEDLTQAFKQTRTNKQKHKPPTNIYSILESFTHKCEEEEWVFTGHDSNDKLIIVYDPFSFLCFAHEKIISHLRADLPDKYIIPFKSGANQYFSVEPTTYIDIIYPGRCNNNHFHISECGHLGEVDRDAILFNLYNLLFHLY